MLNREVEPDLKIGTQYTFTGGPQGDINCTANGAAWKGQLLTFVRGV